MTQFSVAIFLCEYYLCNVYKKYYIYEKTDKNIGRNAGGVVAFVVGFARSI